MKQLELGIELGVAPMASGHNPVPANARPGSRPDATKDGARHARAGSSTDRALMRGSTEVEPIENVGQALLGLDKLSRLESPVRRLRLSRSISAGGSDGGADIRGARTAPLRRNDRVGEHNTTHPVSCPPDVGHEPPLFIEGNWSCQPVPGFSGIGRGSTEVSGTKIPPQAVGYPVQALLGLDKRTSSRTPAQGHLETLRELIKQKWPEATFGDQLETQARIKINLPELRTVLPDPGLPYGQLIEITGGVCSGKTSVLLKTLAAMSPTPRILYVDSRETFFPPAAVAAGIDLERLLVLRNRDLSGAIHAMEQLLSRKAADCVVLDLVGVREEMPRILLHRLRQQIVRAQALAFFLTDDAVRILPASLISLQLSVNRLNRQTLEVTTTRSRITNEGTKGVFHLEAA